MHPDTFAFLNTQERNTTKDELKYKGAVGVGVEVNRALVGVEKAAARAVALVYGRRRVGEVVVRSGTCALGLVAEDPRLARLRGDDEE